MMVCSEARSVVAYCWDRNTGLYTHAEKYITEAGFGLPSGMTLDEPDINNGKAAIRDVSLDQWNYVDDDRGRERYVKFDGSKHITTKLLEDLNPHYYTQIEPPKIEGNQLVRFNDELQDWQIGFDWYEKPIWNDLQEKFIFLGDFFAPNRNQTHIEPPQNTLDHVLDDKGVWIEPVVAYLKENQQEKKFDYIHQVTEDYTLSKPVTLWDEWTDDGWITNAQKKYIDDYAQVDATREDLYRQMVDPLEGEAARKARQSRMDEAQLLYRRIDELEEKIKSENPWPEHIVNN